jgi:hypothetical protein
MGQAAAVLLGPHPFQSDWLVVARAWAGALRGAYVHVTWLETVPQLPRAAAAVRASKRATSRAPLTLVPGALTGWCDIFVCVCVCVCVCAGQVLEAAATLRAVGQLLVFMLRSYYGLDERSVAALDGYPPATLAPCCSLCALLMGARGS